MSTGPEGAPHNPEINDEFGPSNPDSDSPSEELVRIPAPADVDDTSIIDASFTEIHDSPESSRWNRRQRIRRAIGKVALGKIYENTIDPLLGSRFEFFDRNYREMYDRIEESDAFIATLDLTTEAGQFAAYTHFLKLIQENPRAASHMVDRIVGVSPTWRINAGPLSMLTLSGNIVRKERRVFGAGDIVGGEKKKEHQHKVKASLEKGLNWDRDIKRGVKRVEASGNTYANHEDTDYAYFLLENLLRHQAYDASRRADGSVNPKSQPNLANPAYYEQTPEVMHARALEFNKSYEAWLKSQGNTGSSSEVQSDDSPTDESSPSLAQPESVENQAEATPNPTPNAQPVSPEAAKDRFNDLLGYSVEEIIRLLYTNPKKLAEEYSAFYHYNKFPKRGNENHIRVSLFKIAKGEDTHGVLKNPKTFADAILELVKANKDK